MKKSMTDTRFKWLTGCVTVAVIAVAAMMVFSPRHTRTATHDSSKLGEYIYIDEDNIVHADRGCSRLNYKGMTSHRERVKVSVPTNGGFVIVNR